MERTDPAVSWLLKSKDPSVRFFTLVDLLDEPINSREVTKTRVAIPNGRRVKALLRGQHRDGGFGVHPYKKWTGAHWRLVSLVELGIAKDHSRARAATEQVLGWLTSEKHLEKIKTVNGLVRRCASQEGNALAVCSRLGLDRDPRVVRLAESLIAWQWPDGGWNCDIREEAHHSSFYESLAPMWGLIQYHLASGDHRSFQAARKTAEFFLRHQLFRSERTGRVIDDEWLRLHYPLYWHYDVLQALRILMPLNKFSDPRAQEALNIVASKRRRDGKWHVESRYWLPPGRGNSDVEAVDWGRRGPNEMITLNALRVLKAAHRIP
ncbi:MAG TPA: hypothetical protein VEG31_00410 [Thermoproteota archaeon]|nr:hypothetical protein [Thermoproteota archaeon]